MMCFLKSKPHVSVRIAQRVTRIPTGPGPNAMRCTLVTPQEELVMRHLTAQCLTLLVKHTAVFRIEKTGDTESVCTALNHFTNLALKLPVIMLSRWHA